MEDISHIKVLIVNEDGLYLAGTAAHWEFTEDRTKATVFDYVQDHVLEQLRLVKNAYGTVWIAVKLDPRETFEFCDRCGRRITALHASFDGALFLCPQCQQQLTPKAPSSAVRA